MRKEGSEDPKSSQWESLQLFVRSSGNYFSAMVNVNQFFFVGNVGARATVEKVLMLQERVLGLVAVEM
ncbi:hypothetical protein [Microbulbifer variabilis]|uniref:hypothetical protein n=1 Tax=Microbulbifer variabilis TaxID=266805 RepID=UPI001CFD2960|nr:hypothetical protein [Microbulbifer variabilis]